MANFCILPKNVDKFKAGLTSGEINPEKLAKMTSEERQAFLSKYVGDAHGGKVNAEFEAKLLLKNQKAGMISWAKSVGGITKATRTDIISRIERMDKVLTPQEGQTFMASLAERRLGVGVTEQEAKTIMDLSKQVTKLDGMKGASETSRLDYGRAVFDLSNYVNELKSSAKSMKLSDLKSSPGKFVPRLAVEVSSTAKAINASTDNSAIFRQGWKTLWTNPVIWGKNATKTFSTIAKELGGKNVQREVTADIVSRPTFDLMKKAKLAVGNLEEAYPTTFPEKIPGFKRLYKASESAYTGFIQKTRADVFDKYIEIAKNTGVDISSTKELEAIGRVVNSLTGRGNIGVFEPAGNVINSVFFSPRFLASNIQTFTQPLTAGTAFARKQAALNLLKVASGTAGVLGIANAVMPGSVEWDPRSANFGKIKVGNTRFDVTGGIGSLITFASRLGTLESKSSTTGMVTKLNSGEYGSQTGYDVVVNYASNKLSPAAGVIRDLLKGSDFNGNKLTVGNEIYVTFSPMIVRNVQQLATDPNSANFLISVIAETLGISTNTYGAKGDSQNTSWSTSTSAKISDFKSKVGDTKFTEASKLYDNAYNAWINGAQNNPAWDKTPLAEQQSLIQKEQSQLQSDVFKMYNFKYKAPKKVKTDTSLLQTLNQVKK